MKRVPAFSAVLILTFGCIEGCSSDENTGAGSPDGSGNGGSSAGASGAGGKASGGQAGAGGSTAGAGGNSAGAGGGGPTDAGSDARGPEQTGQTCKTVNDCYPNVDHGSLAGAVQCITKVPDGYCTHKCTTDADCCKVAGECRTDLKQVCASFENTGDKYCFLSCEPGDIRLPGDAGTTLPDGAPAFTDANDFCHQEASAGLTCRSTGGGSNNRRACIPGGGAPGDAGPPRDGGRPRRDAGSDASTSDASSDASTPTDAANDGH